MKSRVRVIAGAALALAVIGGTAGITLARDNDHTLYRADVMAGVTSPYTGTANPIRGINGGGAPWVIADSEIRVRTSGRVDVEVEGLVIGPGGPAALVGINPAPLMKVRVSCLSTDAAGAATVNVESETFPVDAAGNGKARVHVDLPSPCYAPIVFVANAAGAWFAVSGA
ncbi:MAG: hypothetical protein ABI706_16520 [Ilumatobacteraceae bacterium]